MHFSGFQVTLVMLASLFFGSCNSNNSKSSNTTDTSLKSASIAVSELNDVCDFVEAFRICIDDYTKVYNETKYEKLPGAEQRKIDQINSKMDEILLAVDKKNLNIEQVSACENWKDIIYKGKLLLQYRKTPDNLQLDSLKTPCEYLSKLEWVADSVSAIIQYRQFNELKIHEIKKVILTINNIAVITEHSINKGIQSNDFMSCENYGPVTNKLSALQNLQ